MPIKLIAVDMDGTFLDSHKKFNKERFAALYKRMLEKDIRFVVASGNQYYQLRSFFPEIQDNIAFVAENGAFVVDCNKELSVGEMTQETIDKVLRIFKELDAYSKLVVCGKNSAYVDSSVSDYFYQNTKRFYHRLKRVDSFSEIDDIIFKFASGFSEEEVPSLLEHFTREVGDVVSPVPTGHGSIDLIIPGMHKASGIQLLQKLWGISDEETAAFGDSGNDIEMLEHVAYSFAMANAAEDVKKAAKYCALSNNEEGVLAAIEQLLEME
ncbi:MAG: Cof-type HAD-IIB family hydrolase [Trichococcus sp.]|uniref:Cof-type HAD-IIB family hydrolase n=1 Tax=Trichococcus sp. TaxID=1985464 RepID=UPI003C4D27BC